MKQLEALKSYINEYQYNVLSELLRSEESEHYEQLLTQLQARLKETPALYAQESNKDPIVYMHYFNSYSDIYITELSKDRAFGQVDLGLGPELGYLYMPEIISVNMELNLYFEPKPLSKCKK